MDIFTNGDFSTGRDFIEAEDHNFAVLDPSS